MVSSGMYVVRTVKSNLVRTSTSVGTMVVLGSGSVPISRGRVQIQRQGKWARSTAVVFVGRGSRTRAKAEDGIGFRERESRVEGRARVERLTLIRLVGLE